MIRQSQDAFGSHFSVDPVEAYFSVNRLRYFNNNISATDLQTHERLTSSADDLHDSALSRAIPVAKFGQFVPIHFCQ